MVWNHGPQVLYVWAPLVMPMAATIFQSHHGERIKRTRWTELPMPQDVIDCINSIGAMHARKANFC